MPRGAPGSAGPGAFRYIDQRGSDHMTTTQKDILHTSTMPVIALRGLTIFPNVLIHFDVACYDDR